MKVDEDSINKFIAQLEEVSDELAEYFADAIADYILQKAQEYLENGPLENSRNPYGGATNTGTLKRSGVVLNEVKKRIVGFGAEYAPYIEYGTPPHWIPARPLLKWAKQNRIKNPWAIVKAIQKRVASEGTPPKPFLRQAIESAISNADQIMDEAVAEFLSNL